VFSVLNIACGTIIMNIMGTINPWGCENFSDVIKKVIAKGIKCFRVNLKTYYEKEHFNYLLNIINEMILIDNDISFVFDIGFPRDTTRTIVNNDKGYIKVNGNDIYISNKSPYYSKDTIFINANLDVKIGDIIYYGDGQSYLTVIGCCAEGLWEAKTSTCDMVIWGNTAMHFEKEAYEMPHNMELIRAFLIKIESSINYKVALSFVETKEDIEDFVELCGNQKIISKIESQKAIDNLDEIMKYSEHIMLGRGDLLFNTKLESFLHNQVTVIKKCNENNKDIIVSTGILTSMKNELLPARAELIDLILLNELGVHSINLSSHILQSENIDKVVELINSLNGNQSY